MTKLDIDGTPIRVQEARRMLTNWNKLVKEETIKGVSNMKASDIQDVLKNFTIKDGLVKHKTKGKNWSFDAGTLTAKSGKIITTINKYVPPKKKKKEEMPKPVEKKKKEKMPKPAEKKKKENVVDLMKEAVKLYGKDAVSKKVLSTKKEVENFTDEYMKLYDSIKNMLDKEEDKVEFFKSLPEGLAKNYTDTDKNFFRRVKANFKKNKKINT